MPCPGLKSLLGGLLSGLLLFGAIDPAVALPGWMERNTTNAQTTISQSGAGVLQEVAPPGASQGIKRQLSNRRPQLTLVSPKAGSINNASALELMLGIEDWPVSRDPVLGIGPHIALQVDDRPLIRIDQLADGMARIQLDDLTPGSHRFAAWAAYPWGEAVKSTGASLHGELHQWQRLEGTQPRSDEPWLVPVPMAQGSNQQPLLLDWLLWNAPLQNLKEGDARWRIRVTLDGDSFLADHLDAMWLRGKSSKGGATLQLELLDARGEPLQPVFNNRLLRMDPANGIRPVWLKERVEEQELLQLSGEPAPPEAADQEQDTADLTLPHEEDTPTERNDIRATEAEEQVAPDAMPDVGEQVIEPHPVREEPTQTEPTTAPSPAAETDISRTIPKERPDKPLLRPESSLGGSARELLSADGRLRQP